MDRLLVLRLLGAEEEPAPYSRFRELQQQLLQFTVDTVQQKVAKATASANPFLAFKCARLCTLLLREGPPGFRLLLQRANPNPLRVLETFRFVLHACANTLPPARVE
ncbi:hypothetical protein cyc_09031 [Cyclospora cayetanensis]|uniref:Uncharacterized protein n=1 Tax=Cyclospora cayetanensis TaxID=88456 RepID=A0A1D3CYM0_9EIME|nr:hypothetical protein cyc_09031 [Cyclospora cayetanensis]